VSVWRGVLFLVGVPVLLLADRLPGATTWWIVGGGAALLVFVLLVRRHRRLRRRLARLEVVTLLAEQGVARAERRWHDLSEIPAPETAGEGHAYAGDLDLYGHASLVKLLGPVVTPMGRALRDAWLLPEGDREGWVTRQSAVRALVGRDGLRERVAVEAALLDPVERDVLERFLTWLDEPARVRGHAYDRIRWLLPGATALLGLLHFLGVAPAGGWVLGLLLQAGVAWRVGDPLHASFARASSGAPGLRRYHRLFEEWEREAFDEPLLAALARQLGPTASRPRPASGALQHLARLLDAADARFSGMLHPVLAVGLLWDLHVAAALEAWRAGEGEHTPVWLETLGQLEALSALATLAADHPDWCWPESDDETPPIVRATALGHPLLPEDRCVRNDVEVGPPGTVLLVTGSNMSGKSTLLRSIGVAAVLARAGGPVCAVRFSLPPVRVFTSMRVQDSLEEGVSFFMAELRRLQAILEAAREGPTLLYLVDEILQGTNSEERRIAGRRFVRHLIRRQAVGAVTTHDLELHLHPEMEPAVRLVHFRESVRAGTALDFDYRLRPGLATTRNALALAEAMGLDEPSGPAPGGSGSGA
jgi:hypothetical protein